jgi:hypothetical protein
MNETPFPASLREWLSTSSHAERKKLWVHLTREIVRGRESTSFPVVESGEYLGCFVPPPSNPEGKMTPFSEVAHLYPPEYREELDRRAASEEDSELLVEFTLPESEANSAGSPGSGTS